MFSKITESEPGIYQDKTKTCLATHNVPGILVFIFVLHPPSGERDLIGPILQMRK